MTMMTNHDEALYTNMLFSFETTNLQTLLAAFAISPAGQKSDLRDRALRFLRIAPTHMYYTYVAKIYEIYRSIQRGSIASSHLSSSQQMNVVSQDPSGYDMKGMPVGNNSYTPSPETVALIKFKKLPFYEVIDEVIKPTFLAGMDRCTYPNFPRGMKESQFKLFVPVEDINMVAMNCDISQGKNDYIYQFQIRIGQLVETTSNEVTDFLPLGLNIRFGAKACPLPPIAPNTLPETEFRRSPRPINCTQLVKLSPISPNMIYISWIPDGKNYVMALYLVKRLTSDKGDRSSEKDKKSDLTLSDNEEEPQKKKKQTNQAEVC